MSVAESMAILRDASSPITAKYRALYKVKEDPSEEGRLGLVECLTLLDSVLLLHEVCFALGQRGDKASAAALLKVLHDKDAHEVTRHEAAEALGAIGDGAYLDVLQQFWDDADERVPVRETCELAVQRIKLLAAHPEEFETKSAYSSVDPTPSFKDNMPPGATKATQLAVLEKVLMDESAPLFDRYRAMFSLRNISTDASVAIICKSLDEDKSSALFRHELAYILGQLELPSTLDTCLHSLKREDEHPMVRHESAEALGSICTPDVVKCIQSYATHEEPLVSESCLVALDMADYWANWKTSVEA
eukprot:TRINITY_DN13520_c0_g2_i1.p1 TRINITY_DN13520_c0_g2~~TRINITY_DN13520_c0_g2_i1.p1  ORF type:complete len:304 (+),score=130.50 TRINITY_DN13520_c0_g2_i1:54-965(+)